MGGRVRIKRVLLPLMDASFRRMYQAILKASSDCGWAYSEKRSRPIGDHLLMYFWKPEGEQ